MLIYLDSIVIIAHLIRPLWQLFWTSFWRPWHHWTPQFPIVITKLFRELYVFPSHLYSWMLSYFCVISGVWVWQRPALPFTHLQQRRTEGSVEHVTITPPRPYHLHAPVTSIVSQTVWQQQLRCLPMVALQDHLTRYCDETMERKWCKWSYYIEGSFEHLLTGVNGLLNIITNC